MAIHEMQLILLAQSALFQTVAKRMNAECMDYWPDDGDKYASLGLPEGLALFAYNDGIFIVDTNNSCSMNEAIKLVCVTSATWDEPKPPAIAKMNYYDNYKLIAFIHDHYIKVVSCTETTINVESQFCKDGKAYTEEETIGATMQDVRNYLGY